MATDDERLNAAAEWLRANQNQAGSEAFVKVADVYRQLRQPQLDTEALGAGPTAARFATNTAFGIPDFLTSAWNHGPNRWLLNRGAELLGYGEEAIGKIPQAAPAVREAIGIPELPESAGTGRRFLEAAAPAIATGGVGAGVTAARVGAPVVGAIARSVIPATTATAGSMVGGQVAESMGGGEGAQFWGGVAGGGAPSAVRMARQAVFPPQPALGTQAKPNAVAIEADARSLNLPPTPAGVLGNLNVQHAERQMTGLPGGRPIVVNARENFAQGMRDVAQDIVTERQAFPAPTPTTAPVIRYAEQIRNTGGDVASSLQDQLMQSVGRRTPVNIAPLMLELQRLENTTDPGTFGPLAARRGHLEAMAARSNLQGTVPGLPSHHVPYEGFKDWRTGLGKTLATDTGQMLSPVRGRQHGIAYGAATDRMRDTALSRGIRPEQFDVAQTITRNEYMANKLEQQIQKSIGQGGAASARQFNRYWQTRTPEARRSLGGNQVDRLDALSRVAGEYNYPTGQTGLTQAVGGQVQAGISGLLKRAVAGGLGHAFGGPLGAAAAALGVGKLVDEPLQAHAARRLQGRTARQLARGPQAAPSRVPNDVARLLAIMEAAGIRQ